MKCVLFQQLWQLLEGLGSSSWERISSWFSPSITLFLKSTDYSQELGEILSKSLPDRTLAQDTGENWESENNEFFPKENNLPIWLEFIFH